MPGTRLPCKIKANLTAVHVFSRVSPTGSSSMGTWCSAFRHCLLKEAASMGHISSLETMVPPCPPQIVSNRLQTSHRATRMQPARFLRFFGYALKRSLYQSSAEPAQTVPATSTQI